MSQKVPTIYAVSQPVQICPCCNGLGFDDEVDPFTGQLVEGYCHTCNDTGFVTQAQADRYEREEAAAEDYATPY